MVLETFEKKLILRDVPVPVPKGEELLIRVRACGLCGSDLKITGGKIKTTPLPHIPGHEIAGEVVDCGGDAFRALIGKRVITHTYNSCRSCDACRKGAFNICGELRGRIGFELPGGLGEYVVIPAANAIPIPEEIDFIQASIIPCAMLSIYHGINRANVTRSDRVAMLGIGGLGIHGIQFLAQRGIPVTAVDIKEEKLAYAAKLGADTTLEYEAFINNNENYSVIIDNVVKPGVTGSCLKKLGKNGRYVMVAYSPGVESAFDSEYMHLNETHIIGTRNGTIPELREIVELVGSGSIKPVIDRVLPLDQANEALDLIRDANTMGRVVLTHELVG
jgi:D-arabinose 1-dehydrogenase-like Zn-dependent alcohol dehydrogenase